jgi:hypothetical protein
MVVIVEKLMEWIAGETEVLGKKTCPSATLSTTNPTWLDPGSNPGRRGGKPTTNRLSYGATLNHGPFLLQHRVRIAYLPCALHASAEN